MKWRCDRRVLTPLTRGGTMRSS